MAQPDRRGRGRCHPPHLSPLPHRGEETGEGGDVCNHAMAYAKLKRMERIGGLSCEGARSVEP